MANIQYVDASVTIHEECPDEFTLDKMRTTEMRRAIESSGCMHATSRLVHIKGFTSGLAILTVPQLSEVVNKLVEFIRKKKVNTIVWDGDNYAEDSFTCVLPSLQKELPEVQFIAFLTTCERYKRWNNDKGFDGSWNDRLERLQVFMIDDKCTSGDRYDRLGILALQATQAELVIAIGGGMVVRQEYDARPSGVNFVLFNALRNCSSNKDNATMLPSSIYGLEDVQVCEMPEVEVGAVQHPWFAAPNMKMVGSITKS